MQFCEHVYFGRKAEANRTEILEKLQRGKLQPEVYVITPPLDGNNLLEIYPSAEFLLPPFCAQERRIVGVAVTYWEALEVVRQIVDDLQKQGKL